MDHTKKDTLPLFIGTYTHNGSKGIYALDINTSDWEADIASIIPADNPSFLAFSPEGNMLYAVNESGISMQDTISAFRLNESGTWEYVKSLTTRGTDPCYITATKKHLFIANYSSGSLCVINLETDGTPIEVVQLISFEGKGPDKNRQTASHIHCTYLSPDQSYLFVTDLGADKVYSYKYEPDQEQPLTIIDVIETAPGAGPRHITFNKTGNIAYLILELNASVSVYSHNQGMLTHLQTLEMEAPDFSGAICAADIHLSNDGQYLYTSNRGDSDKIFVFEIQKNQLLKKIQEIKSGGQGPRNFILSPDNKSVLVAHQYSNNIVIFEREKTSGMLKRTERTIEINAPVCIVTKYKMAEFSE